MRKIESAINSFCYRHPRFGISNLMLYIVIANAAVFILAAMDTTGLFLGYLTFNPQLILKGEVWRLFTFVFLPLNSNSLLWTAVALYFYYFIGSTLERHWGAGRFTIFYFSGVLLTALYSVIAGLVLHSGYMNVSASFINLSMFFAFAVLFPETRVLLFFIIPVKVKWLALVDAALFVLAIITGRLPESLLPLIAILNFFVFCGGSLSGFFRSSRISNSRQSRDFRSAMRRSKHEDERKPYRHRCAVCGRTDTQYPNLEFRYCSRCAGYRCFCEDHINSHVHFTAEGPPL